METLDTSESREARPGERKLCFTFVPRVLSRERILACLSSSHIKAAKLQTSADFVHIAEDRRSRYQFPENVTAPEAVALELKRNEILRLIPTHGFYL